MSEAHGGLCGVEALVPSIEKHQHFESEHAVMVADVERLASGMFSQPWISQRK